MGKNFLDINLNTPPRCAGRSIRSAVMCENAENFHDRENTFNAAQKQKLSPKNRGEQSIKNYYLIFLLMSSIALLIVPSCSSRS